MSAYSTAARVRFRALVSDLADQRGLRFAEVARLARISEATLRTARHRFDAPITNSTLRGLERAYDLGHRELDRFLATPGYEPQPRTRPLTPTTSTTDEVLRFLRDFAAAQPEAAREVRARIDTVWGDG